MFDGAVTTNRIVHILKIVQLSERVFNQIIVFNEGSSIISLNTGKTRSIGYGNGKYESSVSFVTRILGFVISELKKTMYVFRYVSRKDAVLFLGIYQPLVLTAIRIRGAHSVLFGGGFDISRTLKRNQRLDFIYLLVKWAFQVNMIRCFHRIVIESSSVEANFNLTRFKKKIIPYGHLFVDDARFVPITDLSAREFDIVFVGGLSPEKGAFRFVKSLPIILNKKPIKALIIGNGVGRCYIERYIKDHQLQEIIEFKSNVAYQDMPAQFNKAKILVLPSSSEGLPNVILEAMFVKTIVLASTVGGIPDVIKEGYTGFLLKSLEPAHIAERSIELLNKPELLNKVSNNAYNFARANFNYERTLESWRQIFNEIMY